MNTTKISSHQLFSLTASFTGGSSILAISSILSGLAKQDAWISSIVAMIIGIPVILLYLYLGTLFPNKTFIQIIIFVFGKWVGRFISFCFIFLAVLSTIQVISYVGSFMKAGYFITTPVYIVNGFIIILLGVAIIYGLETTARSSEILFKLVWITMLFMVVSSIPNFSSRHILPIMENGVSPVIKGGIFLSSYSTWPLIMLNMIYPVHVDDPKKAKKAILKGYLVGYTILILLNVITILVLGSKIASTSSYPTFQVAKEINFKFLTRTEGLVVCAWIITLFYKAYCYFYAALMGTSDLFKLKDYKRIILPLLFLILIYTDIVYPSSAYQAYWDIYVWVLYMGTMSVVLVTILLIVYYFRHKKLAKKTPKAL